MLAVLIVLFIFLLAVSMIVYIARNRYYDDFDDEEEIITHTTTTTTTTTTDQPQYNIVGTLQRERDPNGQWYVIDPVDNEKIYLNAVDDMYRDAADKIWKLA